MMSRGLPVEPRATESLTVLLIEDNAQEAILLREILGQACPECHIAVARSLEEAAAVLAKRDIDGVLLDLFLPDSEGLATLTRLRELAPESAIVVLTGRGNEETALNALQAGAQDYLLKGQAGGELVHRALRYAIERKRVEDERDRFFKLSFDVVIIAGLDGKVRQVNRSIMRVLGYEPEDLVGEELIAYVHPDDMGLVAQSLSAIAQGAPTKYAECRCRRKDGTYRNMAFSGVPDLRKGLLYAIGRDVTDRVQAAAALEESEERYRCLVEASPDGIGVHRGGKIAFANQALAELLGARHPSELIGKSVMEFVAEEFRPIVAERLRRVTVEGKASPMIEECLRRLDGTLVDAEVISLPFSMGSEAGGQVIARDITARKKAEEALRDSEERYRELFYNLNDAVLVHELTEDGMPARFVEVNDVACRRLGYTRDELQSMTPVNIDAPEARGQIPGIMGRLLARGHLTFEMTNVSRSGERIPVEINAHVFRLKDVNLVLSISRDIRERKDAESRLRESEERYKNLIELTTDVIYLSDSFGNQTFMNDAGYRILEASPDEVLGQPWIKWIHPEDMARTVEKFEEMAESRQGVFNFENRYVSKNGRVTYMAHNVRLLQDADGNVQGAHGIARDITDRKRSEQELRESLENVRRTLEGTIQAMALALETRDPYTAGHQRRVAELSSAIALEMGLPEEQAAVIRLAAAIHDIGKISVPAEILSRPGRVSEIEFGLIKTHPQAGYEILSTIVFPWPIAEMVLQHHERIDGSGYPNGLKGDDILLEARILAVADVVEAMASHRPYRAALGMVAALKEIGMNASRLYDGRVVRACVRLFDEKRFTWS